MLNLAYKMKTGPFQVFALFGPYGPYLWLATSYFLVLFRGENARKA